MGGSTTDELMNQISWLEKQLKDQNIYIPPPTVEYTSYFSQRDKLTGNTKSAKKKLKHAQNSFLKERIKQLKLLNRNSDEFKSIEATKESIQIVDW